MQQNDDLTFLEELKHFGFVSDSIMKLIALLVVG